MVKRPKLPVTAATRALCAAQADCELRLYDYVEASILELERIYINAGKRGFLVTMPASELSRLLPVTPVEVAREA